MSKFDLLTAAVELAEKHGYKHITRDQISERAGCSTGSVSNGLGTMAQMRKTVVRHAVRTGNQRIIAQAIVEQEPYVLKKVMVEDRLAALKSVL